MWVVNGSSFVRYLSLPFLLVILSSGEVFEVELRGLSDITNGPPAEPLFVSFSERCHNFFFLRSIESVVVLARAVNNELISGSAGGHPHDAFKLDSSLDLGTFQVVERIG